MIWIDKYKGKYDAGYDALRQSRLEAVEGTWLGRSGCETVSAAADGPGLGRANGRPKERSKHGRWNSMRP